MPRPEYRIPVRGPQTRHSTRGKPTKGYKIPVWLQRPLPALKPLPPLEPDDQAKPELGKINGIPAGSEEEWFWAQSLNKFGWSGKYYFQLPLGGGRSRRGGQVLDFFVFTIPLPTPIFIDGQYWHSGNGEDLRRKRQVEDLIGIPVEDPLIITDDQLPTQEASDQLVAKHIGRA